MCTAISMAAAHRFCGRNLDLEYSYNEGITVTPRQFSFSFCDGTVCGEHYAMIGTAAVAQGYPLYFDGMNEKGLAMAALNFPQYAHYGAAQGERGEIASYELIPRVLSVCDTLDQAERFLRGCRVIDRAFSETLPPSPLHFLVTDGKRTLVAEPLAEGMRVSENTVGVLTNSPPFAVQSANLCQYRGLSAGDSEANLTDAPPYSKGQGAFGLPGDLSSMSRFVRAVFTRQNARFSDDATGNVGQMFHVMDAVAQVRGCNRTADGDESTRYTCVMDLTDGVYYYTTYDNRQITAVNLHRESLDGETLKQYPLIKEQNIFRQNG